MGSMLRAFRRRQGATGRGFRRWGRQDRPGAFMRAWLALTDPLRSLGRPGPVLAPLGRTFHQFGGPVPLPYTLSTNDGPGAAGRFTTTPSGSGPELSSSPTPPVGGAPGKWGKRLAWVLKLLAWFKRRPEFPGYDSGGGPRGV